MTSSHGEKTRKVQELLALALRHHQAGNLPLARQLCEQGLQVSPSSTDALWLHGYVCQSAGDLHAAESSYRQALALRSDLAEVHSNLGNVLVNQDRFEEALGCFHRSLQLQEGNPHAHNNLGNALLNLNRLTEAAASCEQAIRLQPNHVNAHKNLGIARLLAGDFARGWPLYEWRWQTPECRPRSFAQPLWDGSSLQGRTLLLYPEQGLGDALMFVRYAAVVKAHGGTVLVECPRALLSLVASCPGIDGLVPQGNPPPPFDVHAPLLSLPRILGTTVETIPARVPYLFPEPGKRERWRRELQTLPGFRVGIVWQGNPNHPNDRRRSVPLEQFAPLALPGVRLYSLQVRTGSKPLSLGEDRPALQNLGPLLADMSDTAAVIAILDLLVTVDTAVAHLAGALGVPAWVALPHVPDWRWLVDRDDSPWYPSLRLFRQEKPGDWDGVFVRLARALTQRLHEVGSANL